jgi:hypothetical protein
LEIQFTGNTKVNVRVKDGKEKRRKSSPIARVK